MMAGDNSLKGVEEDKNKNVHCLKTGVSVNIEILMNIEI